MARHYLSVRRNLHLRDLIETHQATLPTPPNSDDPFNRINHTRTASFS